MLRFQHIYYLLGLGVLPLLILLFIGTLLWRKNKLRKLGDERLVKEQLRGYIPGRTTLRFTLLAIALTAAIIGWANLQMGAKTDKIQRKGVDVIIALDVSKSMLAKDIQPDRLTKAKQLITTMLNKMENDRVGLVIFAGRAYLQVPLTVDYNSMRMLLQTVRPELIPTQGTVISDAIDLSMKSFSQKEKKYKSLVIISDGEDHDESALAKTKAAADAGVIVHTIGIGSPQGATLYDADTKATKLDENGNPVITKLNEGELQSIAAAGRGTYTLLNNTDNAAAKLMDEIDGMEQKNLGAVVFTDFSSYFQYFLGFAFLMLILEWIFPGSKIKKAMGGKMKTVAPALLLLLIVLPSSSRAQQTQERSLLKQGNKQYEQKKYKEAEQSYEQALAKNPNSSIGLFNLGNAFYNQKNLEGTRKAMSAAAQQSKDSIQKSGAQYNIGNTYMDEKKWQEAVESYKQALRNNPQDPDAKYNLSYAQQMLKQQQNNDKNKKNDKDKKDDKKKDKDKQDQDKKDKDKKDDKKDDKNKQDDQNKEDQKDQQHAQPQPSKLTKDQAAQILNALQQEEKNLQDKQQKAKGIPVKVEKDW